VNKIRELLGKADICRMHRMRHLAHAWFKCALVI
jgi:hypothetical protein